MSYAWKFAKWGGINQGVISALSGVTVIINIASFYFAFGEKTNFTQFIGIFLMLTSITLIGLATDEQEDTDSDLLHND